jgi:hypothetical protein
MERHASMNYINKRILCKLKTKLAWYSPEIKNTIKIKTKINLNLYGVRLRIIKNTKN